jgi:biotin operon repressor
MSGIRTAHGDGERNRLLAFIRGFTKRNGYQPSVADMARELEMQRNAVIWHLSQLRDEGRVSYVDGHLARSLQLTSKR